MRDELQQLPAVGPSIAEDLHRLGVKSVRDLARRDPERLYAKLCELTGSKQDRRAQFNVDFRKIGLE